MPSLGRPGRSVIVVLGALVLAGLTGCDSGPKTHPVKGRIEFIDGDVKELAGQNIELMREDKPDMRASGGIKDDGSFELGTLQGGKILSGAVEGKYFARIVIEDVRLPAKNQPLDPSVILPINLRFLKFETSGLTINVPTSEDVVLKVSKK